MTQSRRPHPQTHYSRPIHTVSADEDEQSDTYGEEYRQAYISFLGQLIKKMNVSSLERMLEVALKEVK